MEKFLNEWLRQTVLDLIVLATIQLVGLLVFRANFIGITFPVSSFLETVGAMLIISTIIGLVFAVGKSFRITLNDSDQTPSSIKEGEVKKNVTDV